MREEVCIALARLRLGGGAVRSGSREAAAGRIAGRRNEG